MKFKSASPVISDNDAEVIGRFLYTRFPDGKFTAKEVLAEAESPKSPIHRYFEWDDTKAAKLYRLGQARKMIRCLVVVVEQTETPAFHHVLVDDEPQSVYMSTKQARATPGIWDQILERALQEAISWKRRYKNLKELSPVVKAIEDLEKRVSHAKTKESRKRSKT